MLTYHLVVFGFALAYVLYYGVRQKLNILCIYWIIAAIVSLSAGKIGSENVYFIEIWAVSCIVLGLLISTFNMSELRDRLSPVLAIAVVTVFALNFIVQAAAFTHQQQHLHDNYRADQKISEYIQNKKGPILARPAYLVQADKEVILTPWEMAHMPVDRWDHSGMIEDINNKKFTAIICNVNVEYEEKSEFFTPQMLQAIRENYTLVEWVDYENWIYEPNL